MLQIARRHVHLTSAYFVPDEVTKRALQEAAERGVTVDVLMPGEYTDKRVVQVAGEKEYEDLLGSGVNVHRYQPTMLHAKVLTIDGKVATIGSANFDPRSFGHNEEANLVIFDSEVVDVLDRHFAEDLERSERVDLERWRGRGPLQRAAEKVTELFDHQL